MTDYYLAKTPSEYNACHRVLKDMGLPDGPFTFPTVYAKRDNKVIGVAARSPVKDMIVLYRLAANIPNPARVLIRLTEAFENVIMRGGVTMYIIGIDRNNTKLDEIVQRLIGHGPYAKDDKDNWYLRRLA